MAAQTISAFLRAVSQPAARASLSRGADGGILVPRHLYSALLPHKPQDPVPQVQLGERHCAIAPLDNARLYQDDELAARALLLALISALTQKVPRWVLRFYPLEMEASADATYRNPQGKLVSAFEADQTVFRLSCRIPDVNAQTIEQEQWG